MRAGTLLLTLLLAAAAPMRSFPIEGVGSLSLPLPQAWTVERLQDGTLKFHAPSDERFMLTVLRNRGGSADFVDAARVRGLVEAQGRHQLEGAVESRVELVELRGASSTGYYFSFTGRALVDEEPPEGEYRVMTQGVLGAGDQLLYFTVLSQKKDSAGVREALAALREARIGPAL